MVECGKNKTPNILPFIKKDLNFKIYLFNSIGAVKANGIAIYSHIEHRTMLIQLYQLKTMNEK